jgi:8-oxo-dGTP pyrophosphatase MutT (NUDIX family)
MDGHRDGPIRPARRLVAMSGWHPDCYQRAAAYVTDPSGRLLVFDHVGVDAGTQVPAGGIHEGESAEDAVLRELAEESGLETAVFVRKLGEAWGRSELGNVPAGLEEHIQHAFHLRLDRQPPDEQWEWHEKSGGEVMEHLFACRWAPLEEAARILWPHQAMWVNPVRVSLRHL